jgi:hypothetical protein
MSDSEYYDHGHSCQCLLFVWLGLTHNGYALSAIVNFSSQFHRNVGSDVV